MSYRVDLNSDLGEGFGQYTVADDSLIMSYISSANIACGFHAGDPVVIGKSIRAMKSAAGSIGAHPGFPDLMGFGRRNMQLSFEEAKAYVQYQVSALMGMCKAQGVSLQHVKPHGALYNMAAIDYELSRALCEAVKELDANLIILGLSGSKMIQAAQDLGMRTAQEVFADRAYEDDGTLVSRGKKGALIHDEELAIQRVARMIKEQKVESINGKDISIQADSICVHGDGEKALLFVQKIKEELQRQGIQIAPLNTFI